MTLYEEPYNEERCRIVESGEPCEELRSTKNVQIIDGATNCTYHIYAFTDEQFALLFPEEGQDVEFIEDAWGRLTPEQRERAFSGAWTRPVRKPDAQGIHGTLFYGLDYKKEYYPSKRESDVAGPPHSPTVWLFVPEVGLSDTPGEDPEETDTPLPNWTPDRRRCHSLPTLTGCPCALSEPASFFGTKSQTQSDAERPPATSETQPCR